MMAMIEKLFEYGLAGVVVGLGAILVVGPIVKSMLSHQKEQVELLRFSINNNTKAIDAFRDFQKSEDRVRKLMINTQEEILKELKKLAGSQ